MCAIQSILLLLSLQAAGGEMEMQNNSSQQLHNVFRTLPDSVVKAVIGRSRGEIYKALRSAIKPMFFTFATGSMLGVTGTGLTILTVLKARKKEKQYNSRFFFLLCVSGVVQTLSLLGELGRTMVLNSLLVPGMNMMYKDTPRQPYKSLIAAVIGCYWDALVGCNIFVYCTACLIAIERTLTVFFPLAYKNFAARHGKLVLVMWSVMYGVTVMFFPVHFHGRVAWSDEMQAYYQVKYVNFINYYVLYPLIGSTGHGYSLQIVVQGYFTLIALTTCTLANIATIAKVQLDARKQTNQVAIERSKATLKILFILSILLVIGNISKFIEYYLTVTPAYAVLGGENVCTNIPGVSNLTEPCSAYGNPCPTEVEFATLHELQAWCDSNTKVTSIMFFSNFCVLQFAADFYVYVVFVKSFRDAFVKFVVPSWLKRKVKVGTTGPPGS